jgi:sulfoacetaldehyde dehydrogenase
MQSGTGTFIVCRMSQDAHLEISAVIARARAAQEAIANYTQEQVDELVTAVAWSVARKDRCEALAKLAVDEAGFGNYDDKVIKILKRVTGLLSNMTGLKTVGSSRKTPSAAWSRSPSRWGWLRPSSPRPGRTPPRRSRR